MKPQTLCFFLLLTAFNFCHSFELKTPTGSPQPPFIRWDISKGSVPITLNSAGSADLSFAIVESEVQQALSKWQSVSGQALRFQYFGSSTAAVANNSDKMNSILWVENNWQYSSSTLAITKFSYYLGDSPYLVDADILMNGVNFKWTTTTSINGKTADVQQVLLHELGHLAGLAHSSRYKAVMYPYLQSRVSHRITLDDRAGVRFLYGTTDGSFSGITPLQRSIYIQDMARNGLPLPIFRWNTGANSIFPGAIPNFTIQFSNNPEFVKPLSIAVGTADFYALKSSDENKLTKLAITQTLWWRIVSETGKTTPSRLRFKDLS